MDEDFSPSKTFINLMHFWWVLALLMITGGFCGVLISRLHKPVYESKAVITSVLDYSLIGQIDDTQEDQVYVTIGQIIGSSAVENEVVVQAKADQLNLTDAEILNSLSLDRQDNRWVLHVRLTNSEYARKINQYWSSNAMKALEDMKSNAVVGYMSQQYINSLATCLQQSVVSESGSTICTSQNIANLQKEMSQILTDPNSQIDSSSLSLLHISFELTEVPELSASPVLFAQNISALAGILIALIIGLAVISIDFSNRVHQKRQNE
jgi:hypothetical protein